MLTSEHPLDEQLSALASGDPEATGDTSLTEHLSSCARCTDSVAELSAIRASLAELPDLRPHRPLRLLPDVADARSQADRIGGWARRLFAPALAAGAALAMVGLVGTASPAGEVFSDVGAELGGQADTLQQREAASEYGVSIAPALDSGAAGGADAPTVGTEALPEVVAEDDDRRLSYGEDGEAESLAADRSPWPTVLFSGVAIMIAAAVLRWVLVPRAG